VTASKPSNAIPIEQVDRVAFRKFCDELDSVESPEILSRVMRALAAGDVSSLTEHDRGHAFGVLRFVQILQRARPGQGPMSVGEFFFEVMGMLAKQGERELVERAFLAESERLGLSVQARTWLDARNSPNQKDLHLAAVELFKAMGDQTEYQSVRDYANRMGLSVESVERTVKRSKKRRSKA